MIIKRNYHLHIKWKKKNKNLRELKIIIFQILIFYLNLKMKYLKMVLEDSKIFYYQKV